MAYERDDKSIKIVTEDKIADLLLNLESVQDSLRLVVDSDFNRAHEERYIRELITRFNLIFIGRGADGDMLFHRGPPRRWQLASCLGQDTDECLSLFRRAFETDMAPGLWRWKYGDARGVALVARHKNQIIAHYGAIKRAVLVKGERKVALAIGDVMVDPRERGVMTKRGAFFQVTAAFLELYFGISTAYELAYGFPNRRHMQVAARLGLYGEVDAMSEWHWPAMESGRDFWHLARKLDRYRDIRHMDRAWQDMCRDFQEEIIGVRDSGYVKWRYYDHPAQKYTVLGVFHRLSRGLAGIVVLRRDSEECKLMDLIGPERNFPLLVGHARRQAARWQVPRLVAWLTKSQSHRLQGHEKTEIPIDVPIPANTWSEGPRLEDVKGRWWLTYGDTDFL